MLVGPARVFFMDEISTGLDSSTTLQIVNSMKQSINILGGTAVISLLQPAPETYMRFDDIILLSDGQIVFQGPREHVHEFFETIGFRCPERKGVADFLQEVTSWKDQHQYWVCHDKPYRFVTAMEFVDAFQSSQIGQELADELARPFDRSQNHPAALTTSKYGVSRKELLKSCIAREILLMKRNSFAYVFKSVQLLFLCVIATTVFLRSKMHRDSIMDGDIFMGALFFTELVMMFNSFSEISMTIDKLPVFYKQRDLLFFPAWAYALPTCILKILISFMEVSIWVFVNYYATGFDPNATRFFKQYLLLLLLTTQMASSQFRLMAALSRNLIIANTFGFFAFLVILSMGGFILSREYVKKWWKWGYWISPVMYLHNAISVNKFLGNNWNHVPLGSTEPLGMMILKSRGVFSEGKWYWIAIGALIGYIILFNILTSVALTYLNPPGKSQAIISEAILKQKHNTTKESIQISCDSHDEALSAAGKRDETRGNSASSDSLSRTEAVVKSNQENIILPFVPLSLTFLNIKYSVDMPQEMKTRGVSEDWLELLKGVSGAFRPGFLTALMGVSGAGKTTLLDVLAGRKTGGYIEGSIAVSGNPKKQETFARVSGYCEQNDIHSPSVTVYESALYSAWLRLPDEIDSNRRKIFVQRVLDLVELTSLFDALVGLPGVNGLAAEQRKRLTIAIELVANPSIIFMDEPTSGLDARAAAIVIRTVRNIVDTGRTVVCTIHQPSIDLFEAFDELYLMKRGGEEIYVGPIGYRSCHLINYFEGIDGVGKIMDGYNPATWVLEQTTSTQEVTVGVSFHDIYKNSEVFQRNKALIEELSTPLPGSKDIYFPTQYSRSYITQFVACLWKQSLSYWRNPPYVGIRFFFTAVLALMIGSMFWDLGSRRDGPQDIFNASGAMFISVILLGVQNSLAIQPVVAIERMIFYREKAAGMFSDLPSALAQVVVEILCIFIQSILYVLIVYPMIGFEWTVVKFFWYLFFMFFTLLYYTLLGMMFVAMTPNVHISGIFLVAFHLTSQLFCGTMVPRPSIPVWWRWFYWADPVAWSLYGLIASQYGDKHDKFDTGETLAEFLKRYLGYKHDFLPVVAVMVAVFPLCFALMYAIFMKVLHFQKR
uniref:Pleiotropic drug resistance protein 3 n=1 Tax=Anthurium amnicola TaxID=1678845 RepID=A0A1D1ZGN1_9ARAE